MYLFGGAGEMPDRVMGRVARLVAGTATTLLQALVSSDKLGLYKAPGLPLNEPTDPMSKFQGGNRIDAYQILLFS